MGTSMSVDIRGVDARQPRVLAAVRAAFGALHRDDRRFSTYRSDSEVSRINQGGSLHEASPELLEVLRLGAQMEVASGGAFRCHDPSGLLDPSGVVKGWSVQKAADVLSGSGVRDFCFNAGGDVVARGCPEPGRPWHVAVRSPNGSQTPLAVLRADDQAVATSGRYERGNHLWDGRTGRPAVGLASVTVIADQLGLADALATTVFALGPDGVSWAAATFDCCVLALTDDGELMAGGDIRARLASRSGEARRVGAGG